MGILDKLNPFKSGKVEVEPDIEEESITVNEAIDLFKDKGVDITRKELLNRTGEGVEDILNVSGYGQVGLLSFNTFYKNYINKEFEDQLARLRAYRNMASLSEISDVIEDATNESIQENYDGRLLQLTIKDDDINSNENMLKNIDKEFDYLFENVINTTDFIWDLFRTYMIDGKVYYERIIDTKKPKEGIIGVKKLPTETMDFIYDPLSGENIAYFQYISKGKGGGTERPKSMEDAKAKDGKELIYFNPEQIGYVNYGIYGKNRFEVLGYLEKVRIPYNQLKLLETSVVIYRIVRAPERLVFRIDTGNMPRDKALKYVEKIKQKMSKKQTYDPQTGQLSSEPEIISMLENYYLPQSGDGRGSNIDTVGGDSKGFSELDDIYYFARKMYRALKYPASRVQAGQENRSADIMFGGSQTAEISRDEIKWARFLERQQKRFETELEDLFLLHLEFKGLKKQYGLNKKNIKIRINSPSSYREQMEQNFLETRFNNYSVLADREEFSLYYLMKKYLKWTEEEIMENKKGKEKDKELGLKPEEDAEF
jgi:hypothetical protein